MATKSNPPEFKCLICGSNETNYGNNPYPLCDEKDYQSRACDKCNQRYVVMYRASDIVNRKNWKIILNMCRRRCNYTLGDMGLPEVAEGLSATHHQ